MAGEVVTNMEQFINWSPPDGGPGGCPAPNPEPPKPSSEPGDEWD